ncbi:MAG: PspC domain-containing protein [Chitinivibrionales bacterium]|nr:PspC domain-containing protein [Chitinivibrionales bacterium]MBD3396071.1 PspC domain-containing protein [Chitinivibrionales bacterium]
MRKLYRLSGEDQKKIAGICAGIADAYGWDPTIVRLATVFLTAATGIWPGIATYLIAWWLVPEGTEGEGRTGHDHE